MRRNAELNFTMNDDVLVASLALIACCSSKNLHFGRGSSLTEEFNSNRNLVRSLQVFHAGTLKISSTGNSLLKSGAN
jgi:hypothetical protein